MSRCKGQIAKSRLPALNLELVKQQLEEDLNCEGMEVCNAAMCHPISNINGTLFIGTWRDAADEQLLRKHRITHLLNVARELTSEEEIERIESFKFVQSKCIPLNDSLNEDLERCFDEAFAFIHSATLNGRVLVYCRRGISRSAAIVIAYIMASEGQSFKTAFHNIYIKRPCISLNLAFIQRLEEFEDSLRASRALDYEKKETSSDVCRPGIGITDCALYEP